MAALRDLTILDLGRADFEMGAIIAPGDLDGTWRRCPFPAYLLTLDDGRHWLVDNGPNRRHITEPMYEYAGTTYHEVLQPQLAPADDPVNRLAELGLTPADIDTLILTHCHFDHCGNTVDFVSAHTRIVVHEDAYADGRWRESAGRAGSIPEHGVDGVPLNYERVSDDTTLADGIHLLSTPGHAPGHMSLHLELPDGSNVILAIDAIYTQVNRDLGNYRIGNQELGAHSAQRLIALAEEKNATLIYGHDPDQWPLLPKAPQTWTSAGGLQRDGDATD